MYHMNVTEKDLVIVRGINDEFFKENFSNLCISFGGDPKAIPAQDAYYVGLYLGAPVSAITYIGIVSEVYRYEGGADFYLKSIIRLDEALDPGHAIRKHEYWHLSDFGLDKYLTETLRAATINLNA